MKQKVTKLKIRSWRWLLRALALCFFGFSFAAGCMAVFVGITDPMNLLENSDLGIYEAAPLGLLFMTIGLIPLYYAFKPVVFWEDYLEPVP